MNSPKTTNCKQHQKRRRTSRRRPSLDPILFVPFRFGLRLPTCLPVLVWLPPPSVTSCLCAFCSPKLDAKALVAAVCQHVDPTIACETFWQHQYKEQQRSKAASAACVCVRSIVVVVIYVIFQNFCLVCVSLTHSRSRKRRRGVGVGVCLLFLLLLLHWSGLVWSLIQAVWPLSALLSCSFALRFRLLRFVQSAVVFYSVCDAVVFSL